MNKFILFALLCFVSCAKSTESEVQVYSNDFEDKNLSGIDGGVITLYHGTNVLGTYNSGGFKLKINGLPTHNLVDISFDLYIHDSWDGNQQAGNYLIGPDIWQLSVDNKSYINTTFSNGDCLPGNFCPPQSYPANYPNNNNNPKTAALNTLLPGACSLSTSTTGSTLYKIHKRISHTDTGILIECIDKLVQKNVDNPKCDESWSVDNMHIKVLTFK
jgi:hypothetical protein